MNGRFGGEININSVHRGAFQSAYIGYWIDEEVAGNGYIEQMGLHRLQVSIIPHNQASRRVVDKLDMRNEGGAVRYLEINGAWEDHVRYAMTSEEWELRRDESIAAWAY